MEVKSRVFLVTNDRIFCATDTKGGVYQKKPWGCTSPTFLELFFFPHVAAYYSDSIMTIQKNPGRR